MGLGESIAYPIGDARTKGGHKRPPSNINERQLSWKIPNDGEIGEVIGHVAEEAEQGPIYQGIST